MSKTSNHSKAPISAEFVETLRELFGPVVVLHVKENDVLLGERVPEGAPCYTFRLEPK